MGTRDDFDDLASWRDQQGGYWVLEYWNAFRRKFH
jgi:hypothetical protein